MWCLRLLRGQNYCYATELVNMKKVSHYAPTNIALCKYWGKRNTELNLPVTSSLSIALPNKGAIDGHWNYNDQSHRRSGDA